MRDLFKRDGAVVARRKKSWDWQAAAIVALLPFASTYAVACYQGAIFASAYMVFCGGLQMIFSREGSRRNRVGLAAGFAAVAAGVCGGVGFNESFILKPMRLTQKEAFLTNEIMLEAGMPSAVFCPSFKTLRYFARGIEQHELCVESAPVRNKRNEVIAIRHHTTLDQAEYSIVTEPVSPPVRGVQQVLELTPSGF